ncbi:hypothetical protein Ppb6_00469 [Photorhabdus australis subsp. thailandensis]|uniref:Uncharacterized protein n=1 Tax=Photorhabdus australis subsp. thailandensis TaxID=2805096 RepID=A0A1C0U892_9GAMM|nr:hypothetical protein Ppb6_00469 [Photorhabdus australis subsp. thailandensis]
MYSGIQAGVPGYIGSGTGLSGHFAAANTEVEKSAPIDTHITHTGQRRIRPISCLTRLMNVFSVFIGDSDGDCSPVGILKIFILCDNPVPARLHWPFKGTPSSNDYFLHRVIRAGHHYRLHLYKSIAGTYV